MNGKRTQLFFRPMPGSERSGSGHGYIVTGDSGWTVTGVVRCPAEEARVAAMAGWGPDEEFKTLSVPLNRVDAGGVWNLSGRGIGPAPGVVWITGGERLLLTAGALTAQAWRQHATERAFGGEKAPAAAASAPAERSAPPAGLPAGGQAAAETAEGDPRESAVKRLSPLERRREEAPGDREDPPARTAAREVPLPSTAAPKTIEELMEKYPEETPFIGLLPGARFVRVPVEGGDAYDHYIVGHIPIGDKGFYLVGVPGRAGWQSPAGLPQFMHYLPGRMGGGYWVRYLVPDDSLS